MNTRLISFRSPIEIISDPPSEEGLLIGDKHLSKGSVCIIGGAPGVGKSRVSMALALAGATGKNWFGYTVHRQFRTMIVQAENGAWRLYSELSDIEGIAEFDDFIRISDPPPYGIRIENKEFQKQFRLELEEFRPDVIVLDPWNSVVSDDKAKDFRESFDSLRALIGSSENDPALVIIHHTRKPKENEKHNGRALLNLFAGSYVIGSVARAAFILQAATDDPEDDRIVWTCCKNNDGTLGERSVWHRRNGLFDRAETFDWSLFDKAEGGGTIATAFDKVVSVLREGKATRAELVKKLNNQFGMGKGEVPEVVKTLGGDCLYGFCGLVCQ